MILKLQLDVVQESYSFGHVEHVGQRKRYIASAVGGDRSREKIIVAPQSFLEARE